MAKWFSVCSVYLDWNYSKEKWYTNLAWLKIHWRLCELCFWLPDIMLTHKLDLGKFSIQSQLEQVYLFIFFLSEIHSIRKYCSIENDVFKRNILIMTKLKRNKLCGWVEIIESHSIASLRDTLQFQKNCEDCEQNLYFHSTLTRWLLRQI